ncbi:MAG: phage head-tail connector protein [Candidatus Saccharimonadales bacterium]
MIKLAITTLEEVKATLNLRGNDKDEQISALIVQVEDWIKGYTNQVIPNSGGFYPHGYEKIAIEMIGYDLNTINKQGVQSESLSRHSITYAAAESNYPVAITKGLRRRLKW